MKNLLKLSAFALFGLIILSAFTRIDIKKTKSLDEMIKEKILNPVKKADGRSVSTKSYSRCPSGYHSYVSTAAAVKTDFTLGEVSFCSGCSCETLCEFRIWESDGVAEIKKDDGTYVSVQDWIALKHSKKQSGNS